MADKHRHKAVFLSVYIDEAHPADGWALQCNDDDGVCFRRPQTLNQRVALARQAETFGHHLPLYVDHMNDRACALFSAWPERLYIVQSGRIEFKGGPGPFGYILQDIDEWLADH